MSSNFFRNEIRALVQCICSFRNDLPDLDRYLIAPLSSDDSRERCNFSRDCNISGILVFMAMIFRINKAPLFTPNEIDIENLRYLIVHWIKARCLPT